MLGMGLGWNGQEVGDVTKLLASVAEQGHLGRFWRQEGVGYMLEWGLRWNGHGGLRPVNVAGMATNRGCLREICDLRHRNPTARTRGPCGASVRLMSCAKTTVGFLRMPGDQAPPRSVAFPITASPTTASQITGSPTTASQQLPLRRHSVVQK